MTTSVKHVKVSIITDSADTNDVRMSDWNDEHNVSITAADVGAEAAGAVGTHAAASDPHTGYRLESDTIGTSDITDAAVTLAKQANLANARIIGRITTGAGVPEALTGSQVKTILAIAASDVSGLAAFDATVPAAIGTAAVGAATSVPRRDHVHATGAGTPSTQAFSDAAATGSGPAASMTDHKHAMPSLATNTITLGSSVVAGSATTAARSDAGIAAFDATVPTTIASGDAAATGSINFAARRDHKHGMVNVAQSVVVANNVTHTQSNTTLENVTGLTFNIGASATEIWLVELFIELSSASTTVDVKWGWATMPASATMRWGGSGAGGLTGYAGPATGTTATAMAAATATVSEGTGTATTIAGYKIEGKVYGGGTTGAIQFMFAQDTSTATNIIVLAGSHMRYTKLVA